MFTPVTMQKSVRDMSPEDQHLGFSSAREDVSLSCGHLVSSHEPGRGSVATLETLHSCHGDISNGKSHFLQTLMDAEAAAKAAAIQLMSFKHSMDDADSGSSATDKHQLTRQRRLLLEKLEHFRRTNKSVRQILKQLQDLEAEKLEKCQIDTLKNKIAQTESENERLKRDMSEAERRIEEVMDLWRKEQEKTKSTTHLTKTVEETCTHLQGQLRNMEAENNCLLRTLEKTLTEQKLEINDLKNCTTSLTKKAAKEEDALKKAWRAQKRRAERLEAATDKCYKQLKEKGSQTSSSPSNSVSRRRKTEITDEKLKFVAHIELVKSEIAMLKKLLREKDERTAAAESVMELVDKLTTENEDLSVSNAALKASVAQLEQKLADCESALAEEKVVSEARKHQADQCQHQVVELQAEIDDLRTKHANVLSKTKMIQDVKDADVQELRQETQGRAEELKTCRELLRAAEQSQSIVQEKLQHSERKCSEQSEFIRQLQAKTESEITFMTTVTDTNESIHKSNLGLHKKVLSLQMQIRKLHQENLELVQKVTVQQEDLRYRNQELDQRSSECQALHRQLNAVLIDLKQQENRNEGWALSREEDLQSKILAFEAEKGRQDSELRLLSQRKPTAEKEFEVRLKDMQLNLDQSESHTQSIPDYVDFLKTCY